MVNIDKRAVLFLASCFAQPLLHTASSSFADDFSNFTGNLSAYRFASDLWVSEKIDRKRKRLLVAECDPYDRVRSLFYKNLRLVACWRVLSGWHVQKWVSKGGGRASFLACFHYLGSCINWDFGKEITNVHQETIRVFFLNMFCKWGKDLARNEVKLLATEKDIRNVVSICERIESSGCCWLVD